MDQTSWKTVTSRALKGKNMAFIRDIPAASEFLSDSQSKIKNNFNGSDDVFGVDHYQFSNTTAKIGGHKQCQLDEQVSADGSLPVGLKGAGWETLYASVSNSVGDLWMSRGGAPGIRLTGPDTPTAANNGHTFLPGGIVINWGQVNSTTKTPFQALSFSASANNIQFPNNCFAVFTQVHGSSDIPGSQANVDVRKGTLDKTGFHWAFVTNSSDYTGFFWIAIGN